MLLIATCNFCRRRFDDDKAPELIKFKKQPKPEKDMSKQFLELDYREQKEVCMVFYERCNHPVTLRSEALSKAVEQLKERRQTEVKPEA